MESGGFHLTEVEVVQIRSDWLATFVDFEKIGLRSNAFEGVVGGRGFDELGEGNCFILYVEKCIECGGIWDEDGWKIVTLRSFVP